MTNPLITLHDSIAQFRKSDNTLDLTRLPVGADVLSLLEEQGGLTVRNAVIGYSADGTAVALTGDVDFGDGRSIDLRASFTASDPPACRLLLILGDPGAWEADGSTLPFDLQVTAFRLLAGGDPPFAVTVWAQIVDDPTAPIPFTLELPDPDGIWRFHGESDTVPVTISRIARLLTLDDLAQAFPWQFNAVGVSDLSVGYKPGTGIADISCTFASTDKFDVVTGLVIDRFLARISVRDPQSASRAVDLYLAGAITLAGQPVLLEAFRQGTSDAAGKWSFTGTLTDVNLSALISDLARQLGISLPLPDALPDLEFSTVSLSCTPADRTFSFTADTDGKWEFPRNGGGIAVTTAHFELRREVANDVATYPFSIHLKGTNEAAPADAWIPGVAARSVDLQLAYDGTTWTAHGDVVADLFAATGIHFSAGYTSDPQKSVFTLGVDASKTPDAGLELLRFSDLDAMLAVHDLTISLTRASGADASEHKTTFTIDGGAHLTVGDHLDLSGRISASSAGLELSIDASKQPLAISVPSGLFGQGAAPSVDFIGGSIGISRGTDGSWYLDGSAHIALQSFPTRFQSALPSSITGTLHLDSSSLQLEVTQLDDTLEIPLPPMPLSGKELGTLTMKVDNLGLSIARNGDVTFSVTPALRLPAGINSAIFGTRSDGSTHEVFVTDADVRGTLAIGVIDGEPGATFHLLDSPFRAVAFEQNGTVWPCDLGPAGLVRLDVPGFTFGADGFSASGGFHEDPDRPLTLPLGPLKHWLGERFGGIAAALPDGVPLLRKPKLFSDDGHLMVPELIAYLEHAGEKLPDPLVTALTDLAKAAEGLPDRLKQYLEADLPSDLHFRIAADASGSLTVDLHTDGVPLPGGRPIMLLMPALPNLIGLRIAKLQIGPIFGGSLVLFRCDMEIDVFDPITLAASIAASESPTVKAWLPDAAQSHATILAHDLVMVIVYETVIPLPVPVFYQQLGIDFSGPAGLAVKSSISFNPLTNNSLSSVFQTVKSLYRFITDPAYPLPTEGGIALDASIGETYIQLPPYLGSGVCGTKGKPLADVNLSQVFANFLNGVKFFSLTRVLQGIPLEYRCADVNLTFGPLGFDIGWAATTREEFTAGLAWSDPQTRNANALVGMPDAERTALLAVLPAALDGAEDEGLIFLLRGDAGVNGLFTVTGRFGMLTRGRSGIATGVQLGVDFANAVGVEVAGVVAFDFTKSLGEGWGGFTGTGKLLINGAPAVSGRVTISDTEIGFSVTADLFPGLTAIRIAGDTAVSLTAAGFLAHGSGAIDLFGLPFAQEQFTLNHESFTLTTQAALGGATVSVTLTATTLDASGHGAIAITGELQNFSPALAEQAVQQATDWIKSELNLWVKWANDGYERDKQNWYWEQEHSLLTWEALYLIFSTLAGAPAAAVAVAADVFDLALGLLPWPLAWGIRQLQSQAALFQNLDVRIDTTMTTALTGTARLTVTGTYGGSAMSQITVETRLDVGDLALSLGKMMVDSVFGGVQPPAVYMSLRAQGLGASSPLSPPPPLPPAPPRPSSTR